MEVVKEILKWLNVGIIYPISDNSWARPIQFVSKKEGMIVIPNHNYEIILVRIVTNWRVCIDYRKLKKPTRKDHFSLPFIDQINRLTRQEYHYFVNGYLG